jgi:MerR family transcriptional regulator/heat shock protein HspR
VPRRDRSPDDEGYYLISEVARVCRIHPQTLRLYERAGLIKPSRSTGNTRLYTRDDIERLGTILGLTRDMGVNLAGVEIILRLRDRVTDLEARVARLSARADREQAPSGNS